MADYLVELYLSPSGPDSLEAMAERARGAADGTPVRYVRSYLVPGDELCLHVFDGPSAEAVREVSDRAGFAFARVVPALASRRRKP